VAPGILWVAPAGDYLPQLLHWQHFPTLSCLPVSTSPALLHLHFKVDEDLLIGRWGYQPAQAELASAYEQLSEAVLAYQARRWLLDIRQRTMPDPYTMQWLFDEFYPDLAQQLGSLRVAYLVGPSLRGLIEAGPDFQPLAWYAGKPFIVNFFGDEATARTWLFDD